MNPYKLIEGVWMLIVIGILALVALVVTGCATPPQCIKPIVTIERPLLPEVKAAELEAISADAYSRLLLRDRLMHEYAETLEVIVRETAEVTP